MMNRIFVIILLLTFLLPLHAGKWVDEFIASGAVESESVSVMVVDLASGDIIESHNPAKSLIPASVMKTVTIGSLIDAVGIDYTYTTRVYTTGEVVDSVLNGNILVVGGGDPSLNAPNETYNGDIILECIDALRSVGVKKILGDVKVEQELFPSPATHPTWHKEDLKYGYGAGCHSFNFECNRYTKSGQSYSVADPAGKFKTVFKELVLQYGIEISCNSVKDKDRILLVEHESITIDEIMRYCMRMSDNLYAETMLRTLAMSNQKTASTANGANIEKSMWQDYGLDFSGVNIVDGSGLSRSNRMTAQFLSGVLCKMSDNVDFVSFFPLAGQEGTLKKFLKDTPLDSYIALKTGSMRGIQCYAGYKLDDNYAPTHVVVIMINNMKVARSKVKEQCEKMLLSIFDC